MSSERDFLWSREPRYPWQHIGPALRKAVECFEVGHPECVPLCSKRQTLLELNLAAADPQRNGLLSPTAHLYTLFAALERPDFDKLQGLLAIPPQVNAIWREDVETLQDQAREERRLALAAAQAGTTATQPAGAAATAATFPSGAAVTVPPNVDAGSEGSETFGDTISVSLAAATSAGGPNGPALVVNEAYVNQTAAAMTSIANAMQSLSSKLDGTGDNGSSNGDSGSGSSTTGSSQTTDSAMQKLPPCTEILAPTVWQFNGEETPGTHSYVPPESLIREADRRKVRMGYSPRQQVEYFKSALIGKAQLWFIGLESATRGKSRCCEDDWEELKGLFRRRYGYGDKLFHVDFKDLLAQKDGEIDIMYVSRFREGIDKYTQRYGPQHYKDSFPRRAKLFLPGEVQTDKTAKMDSFFLFPKDTLDLINTAWRQLRGGEEDLSASRRVNENDFLAAIGRAMHKYLEEFLKASTEDFFHAFKERYEFWELISHLKDSKLKEYGFTHARAEYEKPNRMSGVEFWDNLQQKARSMRDNKLMPPPASAAAVSQVSAGALVPFGIPSMQQLGLQSTPLADQATWEAAAAAFSGLKKPKGKRGKRGGKGKNKKQPSSAQGQKGNAPYCSYCRLSGHSFEECRNRLQYTPDGRRVMPHPMQKHGDARAAAVTAGQTGAADPYTTQLYSMEDLQRQGWMPPAQQLVQPGRR